MGRNDIDIKKEKIDEFYEFLQEEKKLSGKKAFSIIYFLQEKTQALPDTIERCDKCGVLFDSEKEGDCIDIDDVPEGYKPKAAGKHLCGGCVNFYFA